MHRRLFPILCLLVFVCGTGAGAEFKSPVSQLELNGGDAVVFLGNSITHQCLYTQYVEDYFYTRYPGKRLRFHNSGIGGDRCEDALVRFDFDVAAYKPRYVSVLLGMNDGRYRSFDQEIFDTYREGMLSVIDRIEGIGAVPILITPTMYDSRRARIDYADQADELARRSDMIDYYNSTLAYYGAWVRDAAVEHGYGFVDMFSPLVNLSTDRRRIDPTFSIIADAVHPDPPGQAIMAAAFLRDTGCDGVVSEARFSINRDGKAVWSGENSEISAVRLKTNGGSFEIQSRALPWVLPEEAKPGLELADPDRRLNREILAVSGLDRGRYSLTIDGIEVGVHSSDELACGINLSDNGNTPQYARAAGVMELNRVRNDTLHVRGLRDYILLAKNLRRSESRLAENPGDKELAGRIADLKNELRDFDGKIAAFNQRIGELEEKIYEANRPGKHKYELARVSGR